MDREKLQSFVRAAEADVASLRSNLLIIAQTGDASDVAAAEAALANLKKSSEHNSQRGIAVLAGECRSLLLRLANADSDPSHAAYQALDLVAAIEASLLQITVGSDEFVDDIAGLIDASFAALAPPTAYAAEMSQAADEGFEIDDETLEIFQSEADELLTNITDAISRLARSPNDQSALWEIRRNAHTLKGAAGIVGLTQASGIAHRMEDLLDKMVEMRCHAPTRVLEFLDASARCLTDACAGAAHSAATPLIEEYQEIMEWLGASTEPEHAEPQSTQEEIAPAKGELIKRAPAPTVRVSLDKLDELLRIARNVALNRSVLADRFTEISIAAGADTEQLANLKAVFEIGHRLTVEMRDKLLSIRMVRFGTLETRLARTIHVTCIDENKRASLVIEDPDVEVDTQVIDALIEPLLHLLKNAVVHGVEAPETRRLIGKPDTGTIRIRIEADLEALVLSVTDDGSGISLQRLKEKAIVSGSIDEETAASMSDREAIKLIFDRGLTTAQKLDLNAGRGVGMSIVKESIEARGGTVMVDSRPQRGTTFTILMPLTVSNPDAQMELFVPPARDRTLVLIVDDSASIRRQTQKLVEDSGMSVITANNGAEALELLLNGEFEPHLILSDIEMPQIDGWQLLEYVKTDENLGHIPVVIMTSLEGDEHRSRAFDLGAADFLQKPFSAEGLERVLHNILHVVR